MRISLREEDTSEYIALYQAFLEEMQAINMQANNEFNNIMEQSKYDRLQKLISSIIDTYMEIIVNNIDTGVFITWKESNASLRACLKMYQAGEGADEVCIQIEQKMNDLILEILKIEKMGFVLTERPVVSENELEQLEDICKQAQTEILEIKSNYLSLIESKSGENDIYGTLRPLVTGVSSNIKSFFETSLHSFEKLHDFVKENSLRMQNIAQENAMESTNDLADKKFVNEVSGIVSNMEKLESSELMNPFRQLTQYLYNTIFSDLGEEEKKVPYKVIEKIVPIYRKFYEEYGEILLDKFQTSEERQEYVQREYINVIKERNNVQYFNDSEFETFTCHADQTYVVFDRVADMEKNIAVACQNKVANDLNLLYGAYVLFTPIMEGHINKENEAEYAKFSTWACEKIKGILGIEDKQEEEALKFTGEKFSEKNIQLFVVVVEKIINQTGVDVLNKAVDKSYDDLVASRKIYTKKVKAEKAKKLKLAHNTYGRYTVTNKSIQMMQSECAYMNSILEPLDKFYREKFKKLGENFEKANTAIHTLSTFISSWGSGAWDLSKLLLKEETEKPGIQNESDKINGLFRTIMQKIMLDGVALSSYNKAGLIIKGGTKIFDWAMPHMKKSKILVRLSEKVWNLTRQDIQITQERKYWDQYIMEHYELEYGMLKGKSIWFPYYHKVTITIKDKHQRRTLENALFASEKVMQGVQCNGKFVREKEIGLFLNLVRSGMCSKQDMESSVSNEIVDKLYNVYIEEENIVPQVKINPDNLKISEKYLAV